ncbi:DNA-3-methyladenine glycosylase [Schaalia cardiffensis]|uniref:DNA-3-methyladenine glycosylase n=1 Tax=Schaalia cardiffensis TaxID=181487 RepID=UPI0023EFFB93|nr:DNA-3-methyladenine glycosylase [Schaalia cardiffensis]
MTRTARFSLDGIVERDALAAAPFLLGATLSVLGPTTAVSVRLTEVEAYLGEHDPGSHAFRGRTARNSSMFEAGGRIYVYSIYGMHHCANIVCGPAGSASAVLLRAGEVTRGVEAARARRPRAQRDTDLARGPARLCTALGLTREDDGALLGEAGGRARLVLPEEPVASAMIRRGPRTGVTGPGGDGDAYPWRFWIDGNPTVSAYRAAPRRTS